MVADFKKATDQMRNVLCNGCGPQNVAWARPLIPQFVFSEAGDEHDWDYHVGGDYGAYARANLRFYANCIRAIADYSRLWKWPLHLVAAHLYYFLVKVGGGPSFRWAKPRTQEEMVALAGALSKEKRP